MVNETEQAAAWCFVLSALKGINSPIVSLKTEMSRLVLTFTGLLYRLKIDIQVPFIITTKTPYQILNSSPALIKSKFEMLTNPYK